ncbi:MAG: hypothetical protein J5759_03825 [Bacteroidales bacterium]|nr:hypothetical protein [Bacteroidales bacterium]
MKGICKYLILLLAAAAAGTSCMREISLVEPGSSPVLNVRPSLFRGSENALATKGKEDTDPGIVTGDQVNARDELRENFFGSLDIFVKRQADAPGTAWFKEYHLNAGDAGVIIDPDKYDNESLLDQAKQALASNWAEQGYEPDVPYDIYVTANNPHTASGSAPANLTALEALTTNDPSIFRYYLTYTPSQEDRIYWTNCMYSEKKNFLMDGKIEGWTIDPNKTEQVFDVDLKRAAAKILLTVNFSNEKTIAMIPEPTDQNPNPTPQTDAQGRVVYGSVKEYMQLVGRTAGEPRIKPVNFNLNASDIAYDADPLPGSGTLLTIDGNYTTFKEGDSTDNTDNTFAVVTYTYPIDWSSDHSRAPYILLSVFYTRNSDGDQLRSYYRIPVCDESKVTSLERNNIYIIDVEIASLGASNESFEAQDEELRIEYHVIPWTETNMTQEATTVKISDTKYLTVIPTEYTLKGDDTQSVDLQWYASVSTDDGRIVDINTSSLSVSYVNYEGTTVNLASSVTKQIRNNQGTLVTATDANTDGKHDIVITATAPTSGSAQGEKVIITLTPSGIIKVESEALASRAVKDISFTVYLKNASGVDTVPIHIRHFPLDNIQSFTGEWSSRWNEGYDTQTVYAVTLTEALTWDSYQITDDYYLVTKEEYNQATTDKYITDQATVTNLSNSQKATIFGTQSSNNTNTTNQRCYASGHTSFENAAYYDSDGYYYWVVRTGSNNNYTYTYYRRGYAAKLYYTEVEIPSTGSWVEWGVKNGTRSEGIFTAKVYYNGYCYSMTNHTTRNSRYDNLKNNHMYVIQITSTSNKYSLGRPVLDSNYQSQDKVASPAFMIASQLGAVSTTDNAVTASTHCGTYMEVGTDGKRFVGWRLPTKQEIEVIIEYQDGTYTSGITMVTVLGGAYYWALDGTTANVPSGSGGSTTTGYVRCVRDLTIEEVNQLNNQSN